MSPLHTDRERTYSYAVTTGEISAFREGRLFQGED